jgi:hypothetical protein
MSVFEHLWYQITKGKEIKLGSIREIVIQVSHFMQLFSLIKYTLMLHNLYPADILAFGTLM